MENEAKQDNPVTLIYSEIQSVVTSRHVGHALPLAKLTYCAERDISRKIVEISGASII